MQKLQLPANEARQLALLGALPECRKYPRHQSLDQLEQIADDHAHYADDGVRRRALVVECFTGTEGSPEAPGFLWLLLDEEADRYDADPFEWDAERGYEASEWRHDVSSEPVE